MSGIQDFRIFRDTGLLPACGQSLCLVTLETNHLMIACCPTYCLYATTKRLATPAGKRDHVHLSLPRQHHPWT